MQRATVLASIVVMAGITGQAQTRIHLPGQSRTPDFSGQSTKPAKVGLALPASCSSGEVFFRLNATPGANLYVCSPDNQWTPAGAVKSFQGRTGDVIPQSGDYSFGQISGQLQSAQIEAASKRGNGSLIQMAGGGSTAAGDCAQFDAAGNLVGAGGPCAAGAGSDNYNQAFALQTSVTLNHGLNKTTVVVACYDTSERVVEPNSVSVRDANSVSVDFAKPQSGRCVVNATGGGAGSAPAVITSVFGRVGAVAAQTGDYTFAQIGGSVSLSQIASSDRQGAGSKLLTFGGGTVATGDCAQFDSAGGVVSAGAACGSGAGYAAGPGIVIAGGTLGVDSASVPTFLTGTASLADWNGGADNIPAQSCQERSMNLAGAAAGDAVAMGLPNMLPKPLAANMYVSTPGVVVVRLCNPTAASIAVTDGLTFRATIIRSF